ncbi:related to Manganese transporter SMF1 [Saccharomycodes ludwigii]|uniref:Related to Manganese transporter SMF1 n=1 Tax=Saccharomycodes ludwigii TaxID=36035 RepID=A0A376BBM2_9ASCO|nr:related to Manganese transporter SMF1 [Saccharomycodes ludwigii]
MRVRDTDQDSSLSCVTTGDVVIEYITTEEQKRDLPIENKAKAPIISEQIAPSSTAASDLSDNDEDDDDCKSVSKSKSFWYAARRNFFKYLKFVGPGLMVSVAYMDPGNYATATSAGATNEFSLLFVILVSVFFGIFLQTLCIKLGSVTGLDLSRSCKEFLPPWLNYLYYFFAEVAIIATDVAEVIGTTVALNVLMHIPLPAGVVITLVDVLFVLIAYKPSCCSAKLIRLFEYVVALLVFTVFICFIINLALLPKTPQNNVRKVLRGYVPSRQMFENNGIIQAVGILGATVMPHSLFLGSALVQPRLLEYDVRKGNYSVEPDEEKEGEVGSTSGTDDETKKSKSSESIKDAKYLSYRPTKAAIKYCLRYSIIELVLTLFTFALFVNSAILILSGSTLYNSSSAAEADLYSIYDLLCSTISPATGKIFMVALLFSGQSSGIVCTMAGQIVSEGHLNWKMKPWKRRIVTRSIAIIPCLVITLCIGRSALNEALNASQVILSILLPFLTAPLIFFTSKKSIMRVKISSGTKDSSGEEGKEEYWNMANNWITTIIGFAIWLFISFLNVYMIVQLGLSHGDLG